MNYYEHHIGDYAAATAHLSLLEDAVYSRMLRRYYMQEGPLPADVQQVARLVGARDADAFAAVEVVLAEFFALEADGWHQKRCDAEIARYREKAGKARASAAARWNGKPDANAMRPDSERIANALPTHTEGNAHQTPDTRHQKEPQQKADARSAKRGTRLPLDWKPDAELQTWVSVDHPLIDITTETAKFRDYWAAKAGAGGVKLDWPATFRNWIRNARPSGAPHATRLNPPAESLAARAERKLREGDAREQQRAAGELF